MVWNKNSKNSATWNVVDKNNATFLMTQDNDYLSTQDNFKIIISDFVTGFYSLISKVTATWNRVVKPTI